VMDYLEFIARVTSHIPDKGQVTVRYYGLYANAHRGKVRKASQRIHIQRYVIRWTNRTLSDNRTFSCCGDTLLMAIDTPKAQMIKFLSDFRRLFNKDGKSERSEKES